MDTSTHSPICHMEPVDKTGARSLDVDGACPVHAQSILHLGGATRQRVVRSGRGEDDEFDILRANCRA